MSAIRIFPPGLTSRRVNCTFRATHYLANPAVSQPANHPENHVDATVPGKDAEFNDWYDKVHLKEVLEVQGIAAAQRFEVGETQIMEGEPPPSRYLAIYEIEGDLKEASNALAASSDRFKMTDTMDMASTKAWAYSSIGERQTE